MNIKKSEKKDHKIIQDLFTILKKKLLSYLPKTLD